MSVANFHILQIVHVSHFYYAFYDVLLIENLVDHQLEVILDLTAINRKKYTQ
jgi:hypothetical protein